MKQIKIFQIFLKIQTVREILFEIWIKAKAKRSYLFYLGILFYLFNLLCLHICLFINLSYFWREFSKNIYDRYYIEHVNYVI